MNYCSNILARKLLTKISASRRLLDGRLFLFQAHICGGGGIRTHGTLTGTLLFKSSTLNRSATPPNLARFIISESMVIGQRY